MKRKIFFLTLITIILLIIFFSLGLYIFNNHLLKKTLEEDIQNFSTLNEESIFYIDEITLFSSSDSLNNTSSINHFTLQNLYQYTDIAFFINSYQEENTLKNTFKSVSISNIKFNSIPKLGNPNLYFKNINDFTNSELINDNKITDFLDFEITDSDKIELTSPILYNNRANPISLTYVNENIKTDYTITDTSVPLTYDGSLLKRCNILLEDIYTQLSFDITIVNNLNQEFKTTVYVNIPLQDEDTTIYDGSFTTKLDTTYKFIRYK